ncbi:MAG: putative toxin-antitoxin system toxin component, PIN family [Candidatus Diapherotrites archaeon]
MIKAVFDTNVFLSALFWGGMPQQALELALSRKVQGVVSPKILNELEDKLLDKFKFPESRTVEFLKLVSDNFETVKPEQRLKVVKEDPNDDKIVEAAVEGNAKYIVTGDKHLLKLEKFEKIEILTPREFLQKIK